MTIVQLRYDLRAPAFARTSIHNLYAAALDQAEFADDHGFDRVHVSEHHGADDGYCPSPLIFAAAVAARTRHLQLSCVVVLPLHDPLRIAEDAAVVDVVSGGRLELTLAAGYVERELAMFGVAPDERVALMEAGVATLRVAWSGQPFEYRGRRARVTPPPVSPHGPRIVLGGSSQGAARRAARIADGFFPTDPTVWDVYRAACCAAGRDPGPRPLRSPGFVHVTEDPDAAWAEIAPHALHENASYAAWIAEAGLPAPYDAAADADELRASGRYLVLTPDECLALARHVDLLELHPLMGGMPPELGWQSIRLFTERVLPALRAAELAGGTSGPEEVT